MLCFRRLLQIPYTANRTNISVTQEVTSMIGEFEPLIQIVRRRKLQWFGHVSRHTDSLANTIMQGSLSGKRTRGRPNTSWIDKIHSWTGLSHEHCLRNCWDRNNWQTIEHAAKAPQRPLGMGMNLTLLSFACLNHQHLFRRAFRNAGTNYFHVCTVLVHRRPVRRPLMPAWPSATLILGQMFLLLVRGYQWRCW